MPVCPACCASTTAPWGRTTISPLSTGWTGWWAALCCSPAAGTSPESSPPPWQSTASPRNTGRSPGHAGQDEATLTDLLFRDAAHNKSYVVKRMRKGVRQASLSYTVQGKADGLTLVRVQLHTGRTHQIRVQFSSPRPPLLGDIRYGSKADCSPPCGPRGWR